MNTLKQINKKITEKEYRELPMISYSFLSGISRMGAGIVNDKFIGNRGTMLGTLIEDMVFDEHDPSKYKIGEVSEIGDTLKLCIHNLLGIIGYIPKKVDLEKVFTYVLDGNPDIGYYPKSDNDIRAARIVKEGGKYIEDIRSSIGKILLTSEEYALATERAKVFREHPFTKDIVDLTNMECHTQFKGVYYYEGVEIKFMMDLVKIDHSIQTIYLYDLKTGEKGIYSFQSSYHSLRYDIQDFLYTKGAKMVLAKHYPGYKIIPMQFVYISTKGNPKPLIYKGIGDHPIIEKGYRINGKKYKGVKALIDDYKWYLQNGFNVEYTEEIYKSEGVMNLDFSDVKAL